MIFAASLLLSLNGIADASAGSPPITTPAASTCAAQTITVGGLPLWVDAQGSGMATVVFESGNGNDSTVWDAIEPQVRAKGLRTFRYDRRGYGRSAHFAQERYSLAMDIAVLEAALDQCRIAGPIIYVAHSYGGALAVTAARRNRRIAALVLVDAIVPGTETPARVRATLQEVRPQYAEVRQQAPDLARTVIPIMEAWPQTMARVNRTPVSRNLPIVDIVATGGGGDPKAADIEHWHEAHSRFVAQAPTQRSYVAASGSGHKVMNDRPELVIDAIDAMARRVSGKSPQ
ncbi:MAG: alpha/beta hydrolase [Sphingomonadales bacterium]|nr:alpha/beta hydrolase [Sphingomonadales bacterium]